MNLILWRHAQAEEGEPDIRRELTRTGRRQAEAIARWLRRRLPESFEVISSPAVRATQTADALRVACRTDERLGPGSDANRCLEAIEAELDGTDHDRTVIVVGHQPALGRLASILVCGQQQDWRVRKGGFWWISIHAAGEGRETVVSAVLSPGML